ncbi:shikimate dehydrogenase family protein [Flavobacterium sp. SM2513]|uniref:shikimate dehydrogenase family protein n=1 Tax=Flavobacterium sp. SM2513 TaxID=3424766 RepID=UPI003D7F1DC4
MANSDIEKYGLIGKNIVYSFSKQYFTDKFKQENLPNFSYENFDIQDINQLQSVVSETIYLKGLNVTIPFKESVFPFLDKINKKALVIGAVNTIKITKNKKLKGYNTDYYGFKKSIKPYLKSHHKNALILGTGGASKAIAYVLHELNIEYKFVSRTPSINQFSYEELDAKIFSAFTIIINCTPVGTYPNHSEYPALPYSFFTAQHLAFDLIYNPAETLFLQKAKEFQAETLNGYQMLVFQAEKAWEIWNK